MRVLIKRDGQEWGVLIDRDGGGTWGIGTTFTSPVDAEFVAEAIAGAKARETGEAVAVVLA